MFSKIISYFRKTPTVDKDGVKVSEYILKQIKTRFNYKNDVFNLGKLKQTGSGANGTYFHLFDNIGIKIIDRHKYKAVVEELHNSRKMKKLLYDNVPDVYGILKTPNGYGIVMEHIFGKTLCQSKIDDDKTYENIDKMLSAQNIEHTDLHSGNIIITSTNKIYLIDFSDVSFG